MTASSTISARRLASLLAVLFAGLTITPAAMASIQAPPDRADALGGANPTIHSLSQMPQTAADARAFHAHQLAVGRPGEQRTATVRTVSVPPPDRADGLGSSRFTTVATPVQAASTTSSSFDWTSALLGGLAGLGIALLAMAAWVTHNRRDVALS